MDYFAYARNDDEVKKNLNEVNKFNDNDKEMKFHLLNIIKFKK